MAALIAVLSAGGCAYQLETTFPNNHAAAGRAPHKPDADGGDTPSETDLAYARAAAAAVLAHGVKDASIPWQNPHTGAGGNITPLGAVRSDGASTCRDFLASYIRGEKQAWLQGAACRTASGKWEVKSLKPFREG